MRAFLLAIPLMTCKTGIHTPEGGGKPVQQKIVRAEKRDRHPDSVATPSPAPAEPPAAERPPEPRVEKQPSEPPRVAKRPPPARPEPPAAPRKPPRFAERPRVRPSPDLCGEIAPELSDPKPMSDEERKPLAEEVGRNIEEIRACYEEARVRADVDGCMFAVFTVDSMGQLRQPYIDTSNIKDVAMQMCVTHAIGTMNLRAPVDDVVWFVLYPFFFENGEIFHSSQHLRAG